MAIKTRSASPTGGGSRSGDASGDWEDASAEITRKTVMMRIYGETGSGRTRLALTAPGPIGLAHTAEKITGIVEPVVQEGKKIRLINFGGVFSGSVEQISNQAAPLWNRMRHAWFDAVNNWAKTVIMDTDTEGWEMIRLARFGELNPQGRVDSLYGQVNAEWRSMFKVARTQETCNIIAVSQAKDEYIDKMVQGKKVSQRTGRLIAAGQKEQDYAADIIVRTDKLLVGGDWKFKATIEKPWYNADLLGFELEGEDIRFPYILSLITGKDESEFQ